MSSLPIRDPKTDHLLTPENSLFIFIDYQPTQINSINSMLRSLLIEKILTVAKTAKDYQVPIVLSTVNVKTGVNQDTIPRLKKELEGIPSYDRTSINAWEDREFLEAVKSAGRKKLIICALWTEACLSFPTLDAIKEGYEVYIPVDAVGGTSKLAHDSALRRLEQAGADLITIPQLVCELQRDWARTETASKMVEIFTESGVFLNM